MGFEALVSQVKEDMVFMKTTKSHRNHLDDGLLIKTIRIICPEKRKVSKI